MPDLEERLARHAQRYQRILEINGLHATSKETGDTARRGSMLGPL